MTDLHLSWLPFEQLSNRQLYDVLNLRQRVFVVEQKCAYLDADGLDPQCWHGLGWDADGGLVASARIVPPPLVATGPAIGRVVVDPRCRHRGFGVRLMNGAMAHVARLFPGQEIHLGAQRYLEKFYASLGFQTAGVPYDEDGIEHVPMVRRPTT